MGIGSNISKNIPTKVGTENNWDIIEAGELRVSLALKRNGSIWAWGANSWGQLGDGTKIDKSVPVHVLCPDPNPNASIWEYQSVNLPLLSRGWESKIVNENVVWFHGEGGSIVPDGFQKNFTSYTFARTINGGQQWTSGIFPFNGKEGDLTHMAAINDTTAWVTYVESTESGFSNYDSKVYKTTDGGKTWILANINIGANWVNCIHFFNKNDGVIIADATTTDFNIYTTSDGGTSWIRINNSAIPDIIQGDEYGVNFLTAIGDKIWFPTWAGRIFYSPDKGKTWQAIDGPEGAIGLIMQISADDSGNIYVDESDTDNLKHRFLRRNVSDGSWTNLTSSSDDGFIFFDCIPGTQNIIMCNTIDNKTRISRDNGQSWIVIDTINTNKKYFVNFINSKTGFCSNRENGFGTNSILKYIGSPISGLLSQQILNLDLKLYPNPSVDLVTLKFDIPTKDHFWILVHDVAGNLLYKKSIHQEGLYSENIDISTFISGKYFFTVSNQDGLKSIPFVKM